MADASRIPGFYKYPVSERLRLLYERDFLDEEDYRVLMDSRHVLGADEADRLVENVIGVFSLPMGVGLNFQVNGKDYIVPLVVEEPSILAAVSAAAKTVRNAGGFEASSTDPLLIGQIQVIGVEHPLKARNEVLLHKQEILDLANSLHPRMAARNGGAKDVEVFLHPRATERGDMLVVHIIVDTRDAMGANMVNSMCEGLAPMIEKLTGGEVFLRILSNLTDRSMVRGRAIIPVSELGNGKYTGEQIRDGIILASDFAACDPYRAATHNKGVMNGIDAVAIATGNDWRAIEAAAHAYAGRGESYTSLTRWSKNDRGDLVGEIEMPLKVGIVGGPVQSNPAVKIAHRLMGIESATELAEVMGVVGLAQNMGALRALSTEGIQRGHMSLHARSVAVAAGVPEEHFESVVDGLIESGEIKVWKAKELIETIELAPTTSAGDIVSPGTNPDVTYAAGYGKVVLLGEHAVVYGARALAAPIPLAIEARCVERDSGGIEMVIPTWQVDEVLPEDLDQEPADYLQKSIDLIMRRLELRERNMRIEIFPHVPRAMGLGSSAALAVAGIRAVSECYELDLCNQRVNELAYECEMLAHGTPSGIDNTLATYGEFMLFERGVPPKISEVVLPKALSVVIGSTGVESLTASTVARVRRAWEKNPDLYEDLFGRIDLLTEQALTAISNYDLEQLGELMNFNQGLLNALQVSHPDLENLIDIARNHGALGAKLTGGGGGGSMIALCPDDDGVVANAVAAAMRTQGYRAMITTLG